MSAPPLIRHGRSSSRQNARSGRRPAPHTSSASVELPVLMHWAWSPLGLFLLIPIPALIGSLLVSPESFWRMWRQPSFLTEDFTLSVVIMAVVVTGVFVLASPTYIGRTSIVLTAPVIRWLSHSIAAIAFVTFAAYAVWLLTGVARGLSPSLLASALGGESGIMSSLKNQILSPIAGVTTWMHLGVLLGPLVVARKRATGRSGTVLLTALFVLTAFRAVFFSERLALIEIVVSTLIASLILRQRPPSLLSTVPRTVVTFVLAWGILLMFFAVLEYGRSWANYYAMARGGNILEFAAQRLLGYYATALNNGVLFATVTPPDFNFAALIPAIGELPVISEGSRFQRYQLLLQQSSNPEFNNISGLVAPLAALGAVGGALFFLVLSVAIVAIAVGVRRGGLISIVLYSVVGVGILELLRIYYFSSSRFLVILIGIVVLWLTLPRRRSKSVRPISTVVS